MKKATHLLVTFAFSFACLSLYGMLTLVGNVLPHGSVRLPEFTRLCLVWSPLLLMLPLPVVGYCLYALLRRQQTERNATTFLAWTMSTLCLVFFPTLVAMFLSCLRLMER